ncbi:putative pyruvate dehydrogenase [Phaeomoniella chlamydospora]|uniref:Putative pyruvate dehydrogenase n=1 Tax=Phaeomoniella chlamydospora TaxID=158046 RepID=A0A0G2EKA0_PHACM|nr:putative pyruvate dehydrogenase [Phaeomoniella chlamydospora]
MRNVSKVLGRTAVAVLGIATGVYIERRLENRDKLLHPPSSNVPSSSQEVPRLDPPIGYAFELPTPMTAEEVTTVLNKEAFFYKVQGSGNVQRYFGTRIASNSPSEDYFVHGRFKSPFGPGEDWMAWGVFDGHAGWETAALLTEHLIPHVQRGLANITNILLGGEEVAGTLNSTIDAAIKSAFLELDDNLVKQAPTIAASAAPFAEKVSRLIPGYAGSCALLSLYDPATNLLRVACTGDSRAVLGRQLHDGTWETVELSADQTPKNLDEAARLNKEHPNEPEMLKGDRVLGIMVSRAFGDGRWKLDQKTQEEAKKKYNGPAPRPNFQTPPYLTAEPVITTTHIDLENPSFLILASDGMWDMMSSSQAVDLVNKWLSWKSSGKKPQQESLKSDPFDFDIWEKAGWKINGNTIVFEDDNVAVHLARNALGGSHHDKISGLLSFKPTRSRNARDDLTVQVIFFGQS